MEVIFARHAEKEDTGEDPYLTDKGKMQAEQLAKRLEKEGINQLYCSDLNRSKQTAEIVSKSIKIAPIIEPSLNEFEAEILRKKKNKWNKKEKEHYQKLGKFLKRVSNDRNKEGKVLIIAHGVTNRIILAYFLRLNLKRIIAFRQVEAGINSVYWAQKFENWRLKFWNDSNHIAKELQSKHSY